MLDMRQGIRSGGGSTTGADRIGVDQVEEAASDGQPKARADPAAPVGVLMLDVGDEFNRWGREKSSRVLTSVPPISERARC